MLKVRSAGHWTVRRAAVRVRLYSGELRQKNNSRPPIQTRKRMGATASSRSRSLRIEFNAGNNPDGFPDHTTFRLEVTGGGVWEGRQQPNGSGSVSASGHGSGGNVEGLQLLFDQTAPPYSLTLSLNARILAPGR